MARIGEQPFGETFDFRIDPALKAAFMAAAEADDKPPTDVLRALMRAYVARRRHDALEAEAKRQSITIAERSRDPSSDDYASLEELDALFDADHFAREWKA